ncbi:MAG TPA: sugar-binding protein [Candidatus Methylacidiphilales bacterium]|nr:sugar-binding protein [Candidatus Methylacidiphilales bacterium]
MKLLPSRYSFRAMAALFALAMMPVLPFPQYAAAQQVSAVSLMKSDDKMLGWNFSNGQEFPGATGSAEVDPDNGRGGKESLKISGDFTKGGMYVSVTTKTPPVDVREISFWLKGSQSERITLRICDSEKRWHQFQLRTNPTPEWQQVTLPLEQYFANQGKANAVANVLKYEAWGGGAKAFKNDGQWKGPATAISLTLGSQKEKVARTIWINDVTIIPGAAKAPGQEAKPVVAFTESFDKQDAARKSPEGWKSEGAVEIQAGEKFRGKQSLMLSKSEETLRAKTITTGPIFPIAPGKLEVQYAAKSDLTSMDNSYNGTLALEFLTAEDKPLRSTEVVVLYKSNPWKPGSVQLDVPDNAAKARFVVSINKETLGKFWVDELNARSIASTRQDDGIRRMIFSTVQLGNLLLPEDSREIGVEIWTLKPLQDKQMQATFVVRDYWGAEQTSPITAKLTAAGEAKSAKEGKFLKYETKINLADAPGSTPLEIGRYYEIHGEIPREGDEGFKNYTTFAILPEAAANKHPASEIPFTARTWDPTFKESPPLTARLGVRICGVRGRMNPNIEETVAPQIDLVKELNMGFLTNSPAQGIEARNEKWKEWTEEKLRKAVQNFVTKFGHVKPMVVNLGNEPHNKGEEVKIDVNAYRIIYTELKKLDPTIMVVGTSCGLQEEYFKYGFGEWLDAYDFHSYEDPEGVRTTISQKYPAMFAKYGHPKPIWSTELGMNSQGMTRQSVAGLVYKKFSNFFAGGGANCSWFGLFYPDPDAKNHDSFASAHNIFDCRYSKYAPKLDAIAYYNIVNSIAIKKFVTDKVYGTDTRVFLFRDAQNRSLLIAYKDKGRQDVYFPLAGVKSVDMIRIDGTRSMLNANDKGIAFTISEDPVTLEFDGGVATLPAKLEASPVQIPELPANIIRGGTTTVVVKPGTIPAERLLLKVPPFWKVTSAGAKDAQGAEEVRFSLEVPQESSIRDADMTLVIKDEAGTTSGQLNIRPAVTGMLAVDVAPIPFGQPKGPGVRLTLRNNSTTKQSLTWNVAINGEQKLKGGKFTDISATNVAFSEASSGAIEVAPRSASEVLLPMSDIDPLAVYQIKVTTRDSAGRVESIERPVSAFVGVNKVQGNITLDGVLDEDSWKKAAVQKIDAADEFFALRARNGATWTSPDDLSADIRYMWDDQYLYVGVVVKDDIYGKMLEGSRMWAQDGLQFLIDPSRTSRQKPGKYDYALGMTAKGPQTWSTLSADAGAPTGDCPDIRVAMRRQDGKPIVSGENGNITYELAIPWARLAPFRPGKGANLGFTLILNEDDGNGRDSFMTWFGNAHNKDVDTVGDLILLK